MRNVAFVALGSSLGDRAAYLAAARAAIASLAGVKLLATSLVEETAPIGVVAQGPYLNQMLAVDTQLAPHALLHRLHRIERHLGRVRVKRWGPRTIDLDIVRFGACCMDTPRLVLPHPGIPERPFWQRELAELERLVAAAG